MEDRSEEPRNAVGLKEENLNIKINSGLTQGQLSCSCEKNRELKVSEEKNRIGIKNEDYANENQFYVNKQIEVLNEIPQLKIDIAVLSEIKMKGNGNEGLCDYIHLVTRYIY